MVECKVRPFALTRTRPVSSLGALDLGLRSIDAHDHDVSIGNPYCTLQVHVHKSLSCRSEYIVFCT